MKPKVQTNPVFVEQTLRLLEEQLIRVSSMEEAQPLLRDREDAIKTLLIHKVYFKYYSSYLETIIRDEPEIRQYLDELTDYVDTQKHEALEGTYDRSKLGMELWRIYKGLPEDS